MRSGRTDPTTRASRSTWGSSRCRTGSASPGLGDMDGDGMLEIIYAPNETGSLSRIVVVDTDYVGGTSGQVKPGLPVLAAGQFGGQSDHR